MENNTKPMTVKEILEDVKDILSNITVQGGLDFATMVEKVGIPVARAINGIQICIDAMNKHESEETDQTESKEEQDNA